MACKIIHFPGTGVKSAPCWLICLSSQGHCRHLLKSRATDSWSYETDVVSKLLDGMVTTSTDVLSPGMTKYLTMGSLDCDGAAAQSMYRDCESDFGNLKAVLNGLDCLANPSTVTATV